jgi:hypothetical protein
MPGLGEVVAVEVQPDDVEVLALLERLAAGGGFAPAGRADQVGLRGSGADPRLAAGSLPRSWAGSVSVASGPAGAAGRALLPGWRGRRMVRGAGRRLRDTPKVSAISATVLTSVVGAGLVVHAAAHLGLPGGQLGFAAAGPAAGPSGSRHSRVPSEMRSASISSIAASTWKVSRPIYPSGRSGTQPEQAARRRGLGHLPDAAGA